MTRKLVLLTVFIFLLSGCTNKSATTIDHLEQSDYANPIDDPVNITKDDANQIALKQAGLDGHESPTLWRKKETKESIVYSIEYDRDMKVYDVFIQTAARPDDDMPDVFYYVSTENGEIIQSTH